MLILFTIAKMWKKPRCPSTDKEDVVHIHTMDRHIHTYKHTYSAVKKNEILPCATA